jgi:hypothetical protein
MPRPRNRALEVQVLFRLRLVLVQLGGDWITREHAPPFPGDVENRMTHGI